MTTLLAIFAAVFGPTFIAAPRMGGGWFWEIGNAFGFAAFAGLVCLTLPGAGRKELRTHQLLGYGVLTITLLHVFWFLLGDGAVVEFVKPGAPDYMWLGIAAVVMLAVLVSVALVPDRFRIHADYPAFRYWHKVLALSTLAAAAYHIVASGFYLGRWFQALLFVGLALAMLQNRRLRAVLRQQSGATLTGYLVASVLATAAFALLRNLPA